MDSKSSCKSSFWLKKSVSLANSVRARTKQLRWWDFLDLLYAQAREAGWPIAFKRQMRNKGQKFVLPWAGCNQIKERNASGYRFVFCAQLRFLLSHWLELWQKKDPNSIPKRNHLELRVPFGAVFCLFTPCTIFSLLVKNGILKNT